MGKQKRPRSYDASRRRQRAVENQERMLAAARRLFAERGYGETTMESIAEASGVAVPTVYGAFRSKRGLLSRLLDREVSGESRPGPILQTAGARAVLAEPDARRALALFADHMAQIQERVTPTYEVMKSAARTEPDIAEMLARSQRNRFTNLEAVARRLADLGALREGLTVEEAGRTIWVLASTEVRQLLLGHARWSVDRYQEWLGATLAAALLRGTLRGARRGGANPRDASLEDR